MDTKDPKWEHAKLLYQSIQPPEELAGAVASALENGAGQSQKTRQPWYYSVTYAAAGLIVAFVLLLNTSSAFAQSMEKLPVIGEIAQVLTFREYHKEDDFKYIDVRMPALKNTGNDELEARINKQIQRRVDAAVAEAEQRAEEYYQAYIETGGTPEQYIPVNITIQYEIKHSDDRIVSFVLYKSETLANAYAEIDCYNVDLVTGQDLTLKDLLGEDYIDLANAQIKAQIQQRIQQDPDASYFSDEDGLQFSSIAPDQRFYINEAGNVVIVFEKYEIAPGSMGIQEFEIQKESE